MMDFKSCNPVVWQGGLARHLAALCNIISLPTYCDAALLRHAARGLSNFARFHSNINTLV